MKIITLIFCLLFLSFSNLLSQTMNSQPSLKVDSGYINVDGGKLFYESAGIGDNIVLLHDGAVHREIWDAQFPVFAENYRVIRYDRRGYGKSPNPSTPFSNIDDLYQLFIQLKIEKAVIFGMSSGGGLAIDFTLKYPDKVKALVLVGAVVGGYGYTSHMFTRGGHVKLLAKLLADPQKTIEYFGKEDPYEIYKENVKAKEKFLKLLKANQINLSNDKGTLLIRPDLLAAKHLGEIKVPVLILVGEYDIPDVHAHAGVIEFGIPNARREIIYNSGHLIPLEQPDSFNKASLKFLGGIEFFNILYSQGVIAAAKYYQDKYESEPGIILFDENEMNSLGYQFLQSGKIKDAIEVFKLNTVAYPESWNVYDSLGEAYLKDGQKDLAIKNYERSLELNPDNINASKVLKNLNNSE
ncbi:MAG: alpha/beta fold hydrolase [Ignavibacteriaceae bacterium]